MEGYTVDIHSRYYCTDWGSKLFEEVLIKRRPVGKKMLEKVDDLFLRSMIYISSESYNSRSISHPTRHDFYINVKKMYKASEWKTYFLENLDQLLISAVNYGYVIKKCNPKE